MLVLYAIPLAALAAWRAAQCGPLALERRYSLGLLAYGAGVLVFAHFEPLTMREALGFAFLFVCAWSDLVARKVYLPVSIAAFVGAGIIAFGTSCLTDALAGSVLLGGASLALFLVGGGKVWGFGDVLLAAVVGACFGPVSGALTFAMGLHRRRRDRERARRDAKDRSQRALTDGDVRRDRRRGTRAHAARRLDLRMMILGVTVDRNALRAVVAERTRQAIEVVSYYDRPLPSSNPGIEEFQAAIGDIIDEVRVSDVAMVLNVPDVMITRLPNQERLHHRERPALRACSPRVKGSGVRPASRCRRHRTEPPTSRWRVRIESTCSSASFAVRADA